MGVADAFDLVLDRIAEVAKGQSRAIRATVTTADPLTVVLDDDPAEEPREVTDDAAGIWTVGDTVWLELRDTDLVITTTPTSMARLREDADDLSDATAEAFDRLADLDTELDAAQAGITAAALAAAAAQAAAQDAADLADHADQQATDALIAAVEAVVSSVVEYALGASETVAPTTGWSEASPARTPGSYIWMRTRVTRGNASVTYSAAALVTGNAGSQGDQGVSVTSVTSYYRTVTAGAAAPAAPTTSAPPAPWTATEPAYAPGLDLYRVERIGYSTGAYSYTTVSKSSAYAAAVHVANLAEAATQGLVKVQADDPGHYVGRIWYQLHPTGHPQAGQLKALWRSNGTVWASYMLAANDILAPGTVKAGNLDFASMMGDVGYVTQLYTQGLVVSEGNLWPDPGFKTLIPLSWTKDGAGIVKTGTGTQTGGYVNLSEFPIAPGDTLAAQCVLEFTGTATGDFALYVQRRTKATGSWGNSFSFGNASASGVYSGAITTDVTAAGVYDAARVGFIVQANMPNTRSVRVSDVRIVRQNRAVHIANGAVGAAKLLVDQAFVDALTVNELWANKVAADWLAANAVTADKIAANAIDGKTITGSLLRTAASGARIELRGSDNTLRAWNSGGAETVNISGNGATITGGTITGAMVRTAASGARVQMVNNSLEMYDASGRRGLVGKNPFIDETTAVGFVVQKGSSWASFEADSSAVLITKSSPNNPPGLTDYSSSISLMDTEFKVRIPVSPTNSGSLSVAPNSAMVSGAYAGSIVLNVSNSGESGIDIRRGGSGTSNWGGAYLYSANDPDGEAILRVRGDYSSSSGQAFFRFHSAGSVRIQGPDGVSRYLPFATYGHTQSVTPAAANTTYSYTVTFPSGLFTTAPKVMVNPVTSAPQNVQAFCGLRSATSCTIYYRRSDTTSFAIDILAIQPSP